MKKLLALTLLAFLALVPQARAADSTVSAMSAASALTGTELLYCVQGGADRKCTPAQVNTYVLSLMGTGVATALGVNVGSAGAPVLFNGAGGTPSSLTLTNATGLPLAGLTGLGTGVGTALGVNVGTAGAFVVNGGALGTPSSGTLTNATGLPISTGVSGLGTGVATAAAVNLSAAGGLTTTVASGTAALGTSSISSATCATAVTVSATNTATTDVVLASFNGDPTAVTGYVPLTAGMLTIIAYPTANNVNFKVCNNTAGAITPGAITLNWRVLR